MRGERGREPKLAALFGLGPGFLGLADEGRLGFFVVLDGEVGEKQIRAGRQPLPESLSTALLHAKIN